MIIKTISTIDNFFYQNLDQSRRNNNQNNNDDDIPFLEDEEIYDN